MTLGPPFGTPGRRGPAVSRRSVLRGVGGVAFLGASAAVLPLFGQDGAQQIPADCAATDRSPPRTAR